MVIEVGDVQYRLALEESLLDSGIEADARFRFQVRVVGEGQIESVRRADARAEAGVQAGSIHRAAVRFPQHIRRRHARIHFDNRTGRKQRAVSRNRPAGSDCVRKSSTRNPVVR